MAGTDEVFHGGDLDVAIARFGGRFEEWIDLSTGINKSPYLYDTKEKNFLNNLPSKTQLTELLTTARRYCGCRDSASVTAAPGTQALIQTLPRLRGSSEVAILGPTYGEHAASWERCGHSIREVASLSEVGPADVVVLVNPNNPDGRLYAPELLLDLRDDLSARGGWLVVDEAFIDLCPHVSLCGSKAVENLILLRSFGKFFGLAGLRLGFAVGDPTIVSALAAELGPWAVSGPAIEVGIEAMGDRDWIEATLATLKQHRLKMDALLEGAGFELLGGTDLYRFVGHGDALARADELAAERVHVRRFPDRPDRLRFGIPATEAEFEQLEIAFVACGWTEAG